MVLRGRGAQAPKLAVASLEALPGSGCNYTVRGDTRLFIFRSVWSGSTGSSQRSQLPVPLPFLKHRVRGTELCLQAARALLEQMCLRSRFAQWLWNPLQMPCNWSNANILPEQGPGKFSSCSSRSCCSRNAWFTSMLEQ